MNDAPDMYRFEHLRRQYDARIRILKRGNPRVKQGTRAYETVAALKPERDMDNYEGIDMS